MIPYNNKGVTKSASTIIIRVSDGWPLYMRYDCNYTLYQGDGCLAYHYTAIATPTEGLVGRNQPITADTSLSFVLLLLLRPN